MSTQIISVNQSELAPILFRGERVGTKLPTRTDWAKARGMSPNQGATRKAYAEWAKKAGACVAGMLQHELSAGDYVTAQIRKAKNGNITVTHKPAPKAEVKPRKGGRIAELEAELAELRKFLSLVPAEAIAKIA